MDIFGNKSPDTSCKNRKPSKKTDELEFSFVVENEEIGQRLEEEVSSDKSFRIPKYIAIILFVILFAKLFMSQIIYGKVADDLAKGNKIRPRVLEATRGVVYDSSGSWLARNVPAFDLAVFPSDLPKNKQQRMDIYQKLSEICGIDSGEIQKTAEANGLLSFDSVVIKANITREESLLYEEKIAGLPGVEVAKRSSREYSNTPGLSHVLGYTGLISQEDIEKFPNRRLSDWLGKSGLELQYEENLHGTDGVEQIEVDSKGNVERVLVDKDNKEPVAGDSLTLYINKDLQQNVANFLANGLEEAKKITGDDTIKSGVAVVMDPNTGGVLSLVSLPSYDNNLFANGISNNEYQSLINDESKPMFNRATYGKYPPGSIIKPLMAVAGLAEGSLQRNTAFDTPPEIRVGDFVFPDWKDHGVTDIETAIAESNNIFFYGIGGGFDKIKGLGINKIKEWWKKFGLGRKSGIDLPGEATGLLPDPEWKEETVGESWYLGNTYHVSIGQGDLLVTPIQMLKMVSAVANGGKLVAPQIVKKISDANGNVVKEFMPRVENESVASSDIIETVRRGMRKTVTMGSARNLNDLPVTVAGKTGTAQFFGNQKTHAWFECFAPYDNPEVAVVVLVEGGGGGHEVAVPIARNILEYYFAQKH